jgi:hypothetical protein
MAATALPSTSGSGAPDARTCDASGMAMIHRLYRRGFAEAPDLVRGVTPGDAAHADAVGDHLALLSVSLHAHHEGEDERLWSALETRAPSCAVHVERMKQHHATLLVHLTALDAALPTWRASGHDPAAVLSALDGVNAALDVHLGDEETTIVPVMETTLTQPEVDWFGEHGRRATPKGKTWASLGLILDAQPDGGSNFLSQLPPPVRLLWRLVGSRNYARYRARLTGV